jgi:hypothetical protein
MIDIETMKIAALVILMAVIATILRRRLGLLAVVWAFAIGIFIAGRIAKMQAMKHLRETMMQTAIMQDALNREMQREMMTDLDRPSVSDLAIREAIEDEIRSDEWDDYGSDE